MEDRVRFALKKLPNAAHHDSSQRRRVANFIPAWWNADVNGDFDLIDLANVDRKEDLVIPTTIAAKAKRSLPAGGCRP